MLTILCGVSIVRQASAGKAILDESLTKVKNATSLSMTVIKTTEEFPRPWSTECAYRKGGFLRLDNGRIVQVASPKAAWAFSAKDKTYRSMPLLGKDSTALQALEWLDVTVGNLPIVGEPKEVVWHSKKALRIELDGRKTMTKETKLFVFLHPDTHLPLGISANLGSITQVVLIERLKLDPQLDDSLFTFTPPPDWKRQKE